MRSFSTMLAQILTYDFCPWANRWLHWIKHPLAALGFAALAALACAIFVEQMAVVALAAIVLVGLIGLFWPSMSICGLSAEFGFRQERVEEGQAARVHVLLQNHLPWPVWGLTIQWSTTESLSMALAKVPGRSRMEFEWEIIPLLRGEYPQSSPRLETGFPFGLMSASRPIPVRQTLVVWPRIIPLDTLLDAAETRPSDEAFSDQRVGDSGDLTGTRLFRNGDSLRRVHWAQTARQGQMIVCERQMPVQSAVRVVFDSDPHIHRDGKDGGTLEWSIRIAASVCAAYHRENSQVECCFGHEIIPLSSGPRGLSKFLDALARWNACSSQHGRACDHEHSSHDCRRIHHRHCGAFQVTVTTDLGLAHRTEHRLVHGDQRLVILKTDAFGESCSICGESHSSPSHLAIVLSRADTIAADFKRQWRSVCHAG